MSDYFQTGVRGGKPALLRIGDLDAPETWRLVLIGSSRQGHCEASFGFMGLGRNHTQWASAIPQVHPKLPLAVPAAFPGSAYSGTTIWIDDHV